MRLNKKQKMELAEKQYYQEAAEYVKNYPEELMRVLDDACKLMIRNCQLYVKDNMFHVTLASDYEPFILPYNIAVSPSVFKDHSTPFKYTPFQHYDLENLKCEVKRLQNMEKEMQIKQDKIQTALNKLTKEEKDLFDIKIKD